MLTLVACHLPNAVKGQGWLPIGKGQGSEHRSGPCAEQVDGASLGSRAHLEPSGQLLLGWFASGNKELVAGGWLAHFHFCRYQPAASLPFLVGRCEHELMLPLVRSPKMLYSR
jgi:hypothetical protein